MRPDRHSHARDLTRTECAMAALMAELADEGRYADALGCRAQLAGVSARRVRVATLELEAATAERSAAA